MFLLEKSMALPTQTQKKNFFPAKHWNNRLLGLDKQLSSIMPEKLSKKLAKKPLFVTE